MRRFSSTCRCIRFARDSGRKEDYVYSCSELVFMRFKADLQGGDDVKFSRILRFYNSSGSSFAWEIQRQMIAVVV